MAFGKKRSKKDKGDKNSYINKLRERFVSLSKSKVYTFFSRKDISIIYLSKHLDDLSEFSNVLFMRLSDWVSSISGSSGLKGNKKQIMNKAKKLVGNASLDESAREGISLILDLISHISLAESKTRSLLVSSVKEIAPNLYALLGPELAAKLIQHAGGLDKLALLPASTVQVMGAEKALFRHLRNKNNKPPKHGLIFQHPSISSSPKQYRGKIARALSNEIVVSARADWFTKRDISTSILNRFSEAKKRILGKE